MPFEIKFMLNDIEYTVPCLTIDQIERITDIVGADDPTGSPVARSKSMWGVLAIGMEDATPKVDDFKKLRATVTQLGEAITKITELSGLSVSGSPQPPTAPKLVASVG